MLYFSLCGFFVPPSHFRLSCLFESLLGDSEATIDPSTEPANAKWCLLSGPKPAKGARRPQAVDESSGEAETETGTFLERPRLGSHRFRQRTIRRGSHSRPQSTDRVSKSVSAIEVMQKAENRFRVATFGEELTSRGRRISAGIVLPVRPESGRVPSSLSQDRSWWLQAGGLSLSPEHTT